jgi:hypothetical protein
VNRRFSHLVGFGIATIAGAILIVFGCGDTYGEAGNVVDSGVAVADAMAPDASTSTEEDPPPDEPLPLSDAGCSLLDGSTFEENFNLSFNEAFVPNVTDGGTLTLSTSAITASVTNATGARAYLRRSLCNRPATITCTMRVAVETLVEGQASLLELHAKLPSGENAVIRVKTDETQVVVVGKSTAQLERIAFDAGAPFADITVKASASSVTITPPGKTYDASILSGASFTELRTGIVYLSRSDFVTAKATIQIDRVSCTFE